MLTRIEGIVETLIEAVDKLRAELDTVSGVINQLPITRDGKLALATQDLWQVAWNYTEGKFEVQGGALTFMLDDAKYDWAVKFPQSDGGLRFDIPANCYVDRCKAEEELRDVTAN